MIRDRVIDITATQIDEQLKEKYFDKTVAVVGSSGGLLNYDYGKLIDEHDVVIRCNQASTSGFEKHVGTKTDIRIVNSHYFTALKGKQYPSHNNFLPSVKKQFPLFNENLLYELKNEILIAKYGVQPNIFVSEIQKIKENNDLLFMSSEFYNFASSLVGTHATNGFIAILLGVKYFSKVSCFGFTFCKEFEKPNWENLYYFMPAIPPENWRQANCHSNQNESEIVNKMIDKGEIQFYNC